MFSRLLKLTSYADAEGVFTIVFQSTDANEARALNDLNYGGRVVEQAAS